MWEYIGRTCSTGWGTESGMPLWALKEGNSQAKRGRECSGQSASAEVNGRALWITELFGIASLLLNTHVFLCLGGVGGARRIMQSDGRGEVGRDQIMKGFVNHWEVCTSSWGYLGATEVFYLISYGNMENGLKVTRAVSLWVDPRDHLPKFTFSLSLPSGSACPASCIFLIGTEACSKLWLSFSSFLSWRPACPKLLAGSCSKMSVSSGTPTGSPILLLPRSPLHCLWAWVP